MMTRLGTISWATGIAMLAAVSACGDTSSDPPPPPPSSTSSSSPTTSSPPASPSDAASTDAAATMRNYFVVLDGLRSDPKRGTKELESVATSSELNALQVLLRRASQKGQRQTGTTAINDLTVQSVDLDNSDPAAGKVPSVVIDVCWDVSDVDVLDSSGTSIVSSDRPDTGWTRYTVANYEYATDPTGGWRVASGQDLKQEPCPAS